VNDRDDSESGRDEIRDDSESGRDEIRDDSESASLTEVDRVL
jgi:hypothetical protein